MYDLIKFTAKKEYAESLLKGKLYMNSLGYFWENGFQSQKDFFEGTVSYVRAEDTPFPDELRKHIYGSVMYRLEAMKYCNLFCMVRHAYDPIRKRVERINPLMREFGEYAVIVRNVQSFVDRVFDAMVGKKDCYGLMGPVAYHSRMKVLDKADCFDKCDDFAWQKEWRIVLLPDYSALKFIALQDPSQPYVRQYTLDIGDISDIAEIYKSEVLFEDIQAAYPGYGQADKIIENKKAREFVKAGVPVAYDVLCEGFVGWSPRSAFLGKIREIDQGKFKPIFTT